jgi:hypothetical protein
MPLLYLPMAGACKNLALDAARACLNGASSLPGSHSDNECVRSRYYSSSFSWGLSCKTALSSELLTSICPL